MNTSAPYIRALKLNPRLRTYIAQCVQRALIPVTWHFLDGNFKIDGVR